ncbi:LacI family DNA-binding transcriptional regulator [Rhizobacter sp. P5_C2]
MATIKDVARLAGVGVGTASRVISGRGSASPAAVERVQGAVRQLGFRPSSLARALSSRTLGMIGVFVPDFSGPFFGRILQTMDAELREFDRHMVAANGCGHGDRRQQALDGTAFLIQRECDGLMLQSNELLDEDLLALHRLQPRLAVLNRLVPTLEAQCFSADHHVGGQLAAQALLSRGHRQIAVISGPNSAPDNEARLAGFYAELAAHGIARATVPQVEGDFSSESGWRAATQLLERGVPFTGLFGANDVMAIAAISRLQHAGLRVPEQVSVVGYDDSEPASYSNPRLTCVRIPIQDVVSNASRYLLNACYGSTLPVTHIFEPTFVWRDSVAKVP